MDEKYRTLVKRRDELVVKSALQREQLSGVISDLWHPGTFVAGKNILLKSRRWPFVSGLLAVLSILFFKNHRIISTIAAVAMALRVWQQVFPYISSVANASMRIGQKITRKR